MNEELKPCPSCGLDGAITFHSDKTGCLRCQLYAPTPVVWNRRAVPPEAKALLRAAHELQDWYLDTHKEPMWERLRAAIDALRGKYTF